MLKSSVSMLVSLLALAGALSTANAQQAAPSAQRALSTFPELSGASVPAQGANAAPQSARSGAVALAAAPSLSNMWVYAVGSSNCGWEYTSGLSATSCDHGGAQLRTAVLEIGYGSSPLAWMSGGLLASSTNYQTTPVCVTGGYYSWPCTAGQTVVGFLRYYNLDGYQSGLFKYQNTSTNSPWNTMSVQISIL